MNQLDLMEEQRRLYPALFRALDAVLGRLTLEQNVRLNLAVTTSIAGGVDTDETSYINSVRALNETLDFGEIDPARRALDKEIADAYVEKLRDHLKDITQDEDAGREPGKGDNS